MEPQERKNDDDYHDEPDQIDDTVHVSISVYQVIALSVQRPMAP
jgi:hypothetical protein